MVVDRTDGFIADENYESKWISNEYSRQLVHRWRAEEDAVLVGTRTARQDNPRLTVRHWSGRNPVRVVFDRFLRLSNKLHLFDHSEPTLCYNLMKHEEQRNLTLIRLEEANFWEDMLHDLHKRNIQSIMIEGGAQTLGTFIKGGWWDEARVFRSGRSFWKGIPAPRLGGGGRLVGEEKIMDDHLSIFSNEGPQQMTG